MALWCHDGRACWRRNCRSRAVGQYRRRLLLPRKPGFDRAFNAFLGTKPSTTLADLLTPLLAANPFSAVRASLWRWSSDEFEDGGTHGRQGWLGRRPVDLFFPASLF